MESIKSTIEYLVKEGAVIGGAPLTFLVFFIGAALLLSKFLSWWHRREIDGFKSTVENLRSHVQLCNARIDGLKTEADNLRNALEKTQIAGSSALAPVMYGNSTIRAAFQELTTHPVMLYTFTPPISSKDSPERLAAYKRLEETGLVKIQEKDGIFSVVATPEAAKMYQLIDELHSVAG